MLLIESGGLTKPGDQSLSDLSGADAYHVSMRLATQRKLGGASNLWGGRCVPFDPVDFDDRAITGHARWPVTYDELAGYFQRGCEWFLCGDAVFNACDIPALAHEQLIPGWKDGDVTATSLERWSLPTNFASEYRQRLIRSRRITVASGLTCTQIVCVAGETRVAHLITKTPARTKVAVHARKYVIACGGVESTRLLFASNETFAAGIGNHAGHLGRWYMAHVDSRIGHVRFNTPAKDTIYGHERDEAGVYVRRRFAFKREFILEHDLPNSAMWLINPDVSDPSHGNGVLSFVYLMLVSPLGRHSISEGIRQAHIKASEPPSIGAHLRTVLRDAPTTAAFALRFAFMRYLKPGRKVPGFFVPSASNDYPLQYHGEHLPNWDSYLKPTSNRDALGMLRLRPHVAFSDVDVSSVVRAHRYLDEFLRSRGLGYVELPARDVAETIGGQLYAGYHQAGTTRMSSNPADGVVDAHLAVHHFPDLFVASSSAFVTSGQANSTFMIVAFAARLADRLHQLLS